MNPNYTDIAIFSIEKQIRRDWNMIHVTGHPLMRMLKAGGKNFNKGFSISAATKMLLPILNGDLANPADGVLDADELVEMTLNTTSGMNHAEYEFTHYRANYTIKESEAKLAVNGGRGDILDGKAKQANYSFTNAMANDLASASNGTRAALLGIRYVTSASNSPGNISQATYPEWQSNVYSAYGPYDVSGIEQAHDDILANDRGEPDLILAAYSAAGGTNVFSKMRAGIAKGERYENTDFKAKTGLKSFEILGMNVVSDPRTPAGTAIMLTTDNWFAYCDNEPKKAKPDQKQATDAMIQVMTAWAALGCNDPAMQAIITGIV